MIPNPNAPDEYKYETDYRKIPRKYLNPKIPQGRGKIKWQPFATLPKQFEILEQIIMYQDKVEKPLLTYDSLDNLDQIFQVVEIFFSDKNNIFNISMILIMILLEVFRKR